ncbi:Copper transport protein YcnJ [Paenibacillus polymyxa]|uniref:copper resistance CopC/CopD family protein n=1 Tax=Paenibacillus TaxID=44249 RepID=UPI0003D2BB2F|nr:MULTISPECIES: copper resistance CopC/CopD family protein [Paenibacillus]AHC18078.1 copper resistance protein CopC [Paenibacillus polymyxa CR1]APB77912.1 copper resistance protein CopC [Paenibacillus polymyxa]APQ57614.1 copper resistance protein CopC [Paenibacillus polymyxa]OMF69741.1 copper resistance protein CopC [Paenibacillus peoriae]POR24259.1 copper resistance protein CopC [Paenibacillus polymyxa]
MLYLSRPARVACLLLLCLPLLILFPHSSWAHAFVIESSPTENQVLDKSPSQVTITFNEDLQSAFMSIKVTDETGKRVDTGKAQLDPNHKSTMEIQLIPGMKNGIYSVNWRALSADGHPVNGVIPFQVGSGSNAPTHQAAASEGSGTSRIDLIAVRWFLYIGLSLLFGAICFRLFILPSISQDKNRSEQHKQNQRPFETLPRWTKLLWSGYGITSAAILISLPLQASWDAGVSIREGFSFPILGEALQFTGAGQIWFIQMILVLLLSVTLIYALDHSISNRQRRLWGYSSALLTLCLMLSKAFVGHPAAATHPAPAIAADFVHLAAAAFWIGSLAVMVVCLPVAGAELPVSERATLRQAALRRFAGWGIAMVAALLATGIYGAVLYIPAPSMLLNTSYGLVLLGKAALLLVMLVFAASQFRSARQAAASKRAAGGLRAELSVGLLVMLLTAVLTHLSPGQAPAVPFEETRTTGEYNVTLAVSPNAVGSNEFKVSVQDSKGAAVSGIQQVTLTLTPADPDQDQQEFVLPVKQQQPFRSQELMTSEGTWAVKVHALTASLDAVDAEFTLHVGGKK